MEPDISTLHKPDILTLLRHKKGEGTLLLGNIEYYCPPSLQIELSQGLLQVSNEVARVFKSDGNAHRSGRNSRCGQFFRAHLVVRCVDR